MAGKQKVIKAQKVKKAIEKKEKVTSAATAATGKSAIKIPKTKIVAKQKSKSKKRKTGGAKIEQIDSYSGTAAGRPSTESK